jgi:hypothetical protein
MDEYQFNYGPPPDPESAAFVTVCLIVAVISVILVALFG